MSSASDHTAFARHFDFDTERVSIDDLIEHLHMLGMEPEGIGLNNAMACMAAADLLLRTTSMLDHRSEGGLLRQLRSIDSETWGEL